MSRLLNLDTEYVFPVYVYLQLSAVLVGMYLPRLPCHCGWSGWCCRSVYVDKSAAPRAMFDLDVVGVGSRIAVLISFMNSESRCLPAQFNDSPGRVFCCLASTLLPCAQLRENDLATMRSDACFRGGRGFDRDSIRRIRFMAERSVI